MSRGLRVLAISEGDDLSCDLERRLPATGIETSRTTSAASALLLTRMVRYDLILAQCPPPDLGRIEFLAKVRAPDSASRDTPLLFVRQSRVCKTPGCDQAGDCYFLNSSLGELNRALAEILGSAGRLRDRLMVKATTAMDGRSVSRLLQTRDLSGCGAFLVTHQQLPLGTRIQLAFQLPGEVLPVQSTAQVIRHSSAREKAQGFGVRFLKFSGDGQRRLNDYLEAREASFQASTGDTGNQTELSGN